MPFRVAGMPVAYPSRTSSLRGRLILWLASLLLVVLSHSIIGNYDWRTQFVDATMSDISFSFSSRQHSLGYGLANRTKQWRGRQQERKQQVDHKKYRRPKLPWLLPYRFIGTKKDNFRVSRNGSPNEEDSVENIFPWKIATASLFKLRGGSNKSESNSKSNTKTDSNNRRSDAKANGNKDKSNRKNNRKNNHSKKDKRKKISNSDNVEDGADDDDAKDNEELLEESSPTSEYSSKLFLMDPFRMNEMARYEASIAEDTSEKETSDDDAAEEAAEAEDSDRDAKTKRKKKNGKKRNQGSEEEESRVLMDGKDKVENGKGKKREQQRGRSSGAKQRVSGKDIDDDLNEESSTVETIEESSEVNVDANGQSNSFWWIDVWTQQLSDPEDVEEADGGESDLLHYTAALPDDNVESAEIEADENGGAETISKGKKRIRKKKGEKEPEVSPPMNVIDNAEKVAADSEDCIVVDEESIRIQKRIAAIDKAREGVERAQAEERANRRKRTFWGIWSREDIDLYEESIGFSAESNDNETSVDSNDNKTVSIDIEVALNENETRIDTDAELSENDTVVLIDDQNVTEPISESEATLSYVSSGVWVLIDNMMTIGLASRFSSLRISRKLRPIRKLTARVTRLHGLLSGKPRPSPSSKVDSNETKVDDTMIQEELKESKDRKIPQKSPEEIEEEFQRMERVREIDRLISEGQQRLADLICEKDVLQRKPNPLFDYATEETIVTTQESTEKQMETDEKNKTATANASSSESKASSKVEIKATRTMNFPPDDLVAEYLDMMISTRRLTKMNHTDLWKESEDDEEYNEEESIGDDLFTASADAHRLYQSSPSGSMNNGNGMKNGKKNGGGGSWLLRQSIGSRRSLGEKIGEAAETAAYKAITASLMSFLARLISSLHGINVLKHSDIHLVLEQSPDLPPVPKDGIIRGDHSNYAEETIKTVMRRKTRRAKKRSSKRRLSEISFVQQEAVTETLLSHVQISAPLLKLFPLAWQRALLGNIITLACAIISDFLDGLHFQILGHQLSFAFRPITEIDMARHFQMAGGRFNQRRYKAAEFEAAVQATAEDLKEELKFLDSWHERALGSGVLRTQIANLIARIVLTLTDEIMSGARMDLWSLQAGGPRLLAGLEHRIEDDDEEES